MRKYFNVTWSMGKSGSSLRRLFIVWERCAVLREALLCATQFNNKAKFTIFWSITPESSQKLFLPDSVFEWWKTRVRESWRINIWMIKNDSRSHGVSAVMKNESQRVITYHYLNDEKRESESHDAFECECRKTLVNSRTCVEPKPFCSTPLILTDKTKSVWETF